MASGVKPVRLIYADGGQHPEFAYKINELSRPEAIGQGPREIVIDDKGRPVTPVAVQVAAARTSKPEIKSVETLRKAEGVTSVPASTPAAESQAFFKQVLGFTDSAPAPAAPASVAQEQPFYKRLWSSEPAPAAQNRPKGPISGGPAAPRLTQG